MKKALKIICIVFASILIVILGLFVYYLVVTKDVKLDENKLVNMEKTISFYDNKGNFLYKEGDEKQLTNIDDIPLHVQNAFVAVEDKRFYKHNGIDTNGLFRAMIKNIKSFSFKEGGSTITQQLIKNTHLNSQKTLKRKLSEVKLAKKLEKKYSKKQILEKYLNTIYFGDSCYGITEASMHYFGKEVSELSVNEGAVLAGLIKAPTTYSPYNDLEKCSERKKIVLTQMYKQDYIDKECYEENYNKEIKTVEKDENSSYDIYFYAKKEVNDVIKDYPYSLGNIKVYTSINQEAQEILKEKINSDKEKCDKSTILINKNGEIIAYLSTCGDIPRQVGSTIKPLLVYAPAIENDVVYSCSPILDEKINFSGYSPSNYNDKYYGYVSVKDSLSKSLNSCAVKLLNYTGVERSKSYLTKMNFPLSENDNSLCLALGATEKGAKLSKLTSLYEVFLNDGNYIEPTIINKVESQNNGIIYVKKELKEQVFSSDTTHIVNDMLENTVNNGTAKKLSYANIPLCSKTGTVGSNNGNTDAYNISFNSDIILGVWYGNKDGSQMNNSITGGTNPTILSSEVWKEFYKEKSPPINYKKSNSVVEKNIDLIELNNHNVLLATEITPDRYVRKELFKDGKFPKTSETFINPEVNNANLSFINGEIKLSFDIPDYYDAYIYRTDNKEKILVYDTERKNKSSFIDKNIKLNTEYVYSIVPYYKAKNQIIEGKELFLEKIKIPTVNLDGWWVDDII